VVNGIARIVVSGGSPVVGSCKSGSSRVRHAISTIVIEERALLREGLIALLHDTAYKVVGRLTSADQLKDMEFPADKPLLTIFGIGHDLEAVADRVRECRTSGSERKIAIIAELALPIDLPKILEIGADAWIFNISSRDVLIKALDLAFLNQHIVVWDRKCVAFGMNDHARVAGDLFSKQHTPRSDKGEHLAIELDSRGVSQRERQILGCLIRGDSNKMIARWCGISEGTVKVHLKAILRKIDAQNRTQAAIWAFENGFVVGDFVDRVDGVPMRDESIRPS
jgi:two-component system, NarL family, nitrate/nitrite response regulator NarL